MIIIIIIGILIRRHNRCNTWFLSPNFSVQFRLRFEDANTVDIVRFVLIRFAIQFPKPILVAIAPVEVGVRCRMIGIVTFTLPTALRMVFGVVVEIHAACVAEERPLAPSGDINRSAFGCGCRCCGNTARSHGISIGTYNGWNTGILT